jgi:hypothetical protein
MEVRVEERQLGFVYKPHSLPKLHKVYRLPPQAEGPHAARRLRGMSCAQEQEHWEQHPTFCQYAFVPMPAQGCEQGLVATRAGMPVRAVTKMVTKSAHAISTQR